MNVLTLAAYDDDAIAHEVFVCEVCGTADTDDQTCTDDSERILIQFGQAWLLSQIHDGPVPITSEPSRDGRGE